jgi:hypothetical protein
MPKQGQVGFLINSLTRIIEEVSCMSEVWHNFLQPIEQNLLLDPRKCLISRLTILRQKARNGNAILKHLPVMQRDAPWLERTPAL